MKPIVQKDEDTVNHSTMGAVVCTRALRAPATGRKIPSSIPTDIRHEIVLPTSHYTRGYELRYSDDLIAVILRRSRTYRLYTLAGERKRSTQAGLDFSCYVLHRARG